VAVTEQAKGVRLWDLSRDIVTFVEIPTSAGLAPFFSPDGRYMAVSEMGGSTLVWDLHANRKHLSVRGAAGGFAPGHSWLAVIRADDGTLATIDVETGLDRASASLGTTSVHAGLAFSPDGKLIILECGNVLRFFEADSASERFVTQGAHEALVSAIHYLPDGRRVFTAGDDGTIRQWDCQSARQLNVISDSGVSHRLAVSPDGERLASVALRAGAPGVRVWECKTGRLVREWLRDAPADASTALAFSLDGKELLYFSHKLGLTVLDAESGRERATVQPRFLLDGADRSEQSLAQCKFSPDNQYLATCTGVTTHVVELASGVERFSFPGYAMAFHPRGTGIAVACEERRDPRSLSDAGKSVLVELLPIVSGGRKTIVVPTERVSSLAFSPDGDVLAVSVGGNGSVIRLYRTDDGREIERFTCPAAFSYPNALEFAPDGRSLAAGLADTTVVIWNVGILR
jgi:WD40 repeat protein